MLRYPDGRPDGLMCEDRPALTLLLAVFHIDFSAIQTLWIHGTDCVGVSHKDTPEVSINLQYI